MKSYKELWLLEYERLWNMREDGEIVGTDDDIAVMADERARDVITDAADRAVDEERERP